MKKTLDFLILLLVIGTFMSLSLSVGIGIIFVVIPVAIMYGVFFWFLKKDDETARLSQRRSLINIVLLAVCLIISYQIWFNMTADSLTNSRDNLITVFLALGLVISVFFYDFELDKNIAPDNKKVLAKILDGPALVVSICAASIFCSLTLIVLQLIGDRYEASEYIVAKFTQRGVIPPISVFLFFLASIMYTVKFFRLWQENKNIDSDFLRLSQQVTDNNGEEDYLPSSSLVKYIRLNLNVRKDEKFTTVLFDEIWNKAKAFYMLPFWINWSIPTLGFIGTVLGISLASEGISNIISSPEGLGRLTTDLSVAIYPLGIAFDTTLIALSLSLVLVLAQTLLQKWEEEILNKVENNFTLLEGNE